MGLCGIFPMLGLWRACRGARPDVLAIHYPAPLGLAALLSGPLLGLPTVVALVGSLDAPGPQTPWPVRALLQAVVARANRVIAISQFLLPHGPRPSHACVIPHGVDTDWLRPEPADPSVRARYGAALGDPVLFALQRLAPIKGVEALLEMMPAVLARHPRAHLWIAGDGPEKPRLLREITRLGLEERVQLLGAVADAQLPELFAAADLFVFHSRSESFGTVVAEAMAAGRAIASVALSAVSETVQDGTHGLLARPDAPDALAEAVCTLLEDDARRTRMEQENRRRAVDRFDWSAIVARHEDVLQRAAAP